MTPRQKQALDLCNQYKGNLSKVARIMGCSRQNVQQLLKYSGQWLPHPRSLITFCPCCNKRATHKGYCLSAYRRLKKYGTWEKRDKTCFNCGIKPKRGRIRGLCQKCAYHLDPKFRKLTDEAHMRYELKKRERKSI